MPQQVINLGATGSGAGGDSARTAFEKIIANFAELYPAALPGTAAQKAAAREMFGAENASNLTSGTLPDARVSSTLTADKAFRRGNILGTVSQSGGVPTGAIIERGSNANGEYVRFADGTQICMKSDAAMNGGSVISFLDWLFPAAFSTVYFVDAQGQQGLGNDPTDFGRSLTYQGLAGSMARIQYKSPSTVTANLFAIGRFY
ncbi:hypothetical protein [Stutzerimonas kunmingensis]|uniref:hypothetical protein n=1 Tax=Stutzerimonas kunmingensis TaxID=1211807 RepID=UPI002104DE91|nr:hypothetical protein [Stutzerimonas kunmingensis]MCQ2034462.1 hypothetical protein [Stutzerimonas kunmingensis]